jgi:CheY-like chemotaxis protein
VSERTRLRVDLGELVETLNRTILGWRTYFALGNSTKKLTDLGHETAVASEGLAAVRRYQRALAKGQPFDAVILDLTVPNGIGGRETLALLNQLDPGVTAIVTSGYAQDPVMTNFRDYGFEAVIAKPFTLQELNQTLSVAMVTPTRMIH